MRALLIALLLAGCAAPSSEPSPAEGGQARVVDVGIRTYEPSIAVDREGFLFVNGYTTNAAREEWGVWRSRDEGASWEQVVEAEDRAPSSGDPWLWLDPATDRVFNVDLPTPTCGWLAWSDDGGETWEKNAAAGCGMPGHHFQKLTGGPPPAGVVTRGYPSVLYYSATSLRSPDPMDPAGLIVGGTGSDVSVSLDGGLTWSDSVPVHPPTPGGYSQAGPVAVGPDGSAWSPAQTDAGVRIARSIDAGATWELVAELDEAGYQPYGSDPSLAVDAGGSIHLLHPSRESIPVLRSSQDGGRTWTAPRAITPPEVTSTIFPLVRVLDHGALVAAYLATTDPLKDPDPSFAPPTTTWRLYLTRVDDPTGEARLTTVVAEDDPVQRGCVWMRGGVGSACRNVGDFIGAAARDGLVAVALADGCDACPERLQSTDQAARVALWRP